MRDFQRRSPIAAINCTDEKYQPFFFALEQEAYNAGNIHYDYLGFGLDPQPTSVL